jgi:putative tricarboxylic transport membrane protein
LASNADLRFGLGWVAFGATVLVASWRMDRLESLHINPWSAPGLMPGVLGALMMLFGAALAIRAFSSTQASETPSAATPSRTVLALILCVGYAAGLLGHGWPFWLTSGAFLFVCILAFRWLDRDAGTTFKSLVPTTAAIALVAALVIGALFEQLFLVRLP